VLRADTEADTSLNPKTLNPKPNTRKRRSMSVNRHRHTILVLHELNAHILSLSYMI
jgi:hypothetical protein